MQIEIDFTEYELENLKCKIDKLDPITQAEKVMEYLGKNYTQKQLGEKLSKTRDWIAKRVQFIRALEKLSEAEQKKAKKLVQDSSISLDVIILIANNKLSLKQRQNIIAKHPTVSEARRLMDEYLMSKSPKAKLRVLEDGLSPSYIELERMFASAINASIGSLRAYAYKIQSDEMITQLNELYDRLWFENYRFGAGAQDSYEWDLTDDEMQSRIKWLQMPEKERIAGIRKAMIDCDRLGFDAIHALTDKARQVDGLTQTVEMLTTQLAFEKIKKQMFAGGFSLNLGNGVPALKLDVKDEQLDVFYRTLAKAFHPDKHPDNQEWYQAMMTAINVWHGQVTSLDWLSTPSKTHQMSQLVQLSNLTLSTYWFKD